MVFAHSWTVAIQCCGLIMIFDEILMCSFHFLFWQQCYCCQFLQLFWKVCPACALKENIHSKEQTVLLSFMQQNKLKVECMFYGPMPVKQTPDIFIKLTRDLQQILHRRHSNRLCANEWGLEPCEFSHMSFTVWVSVDGFFLFIFASFNSRSQ